MSKLTYKGGDLYQEEIDRLVQKLITVNLDVSLKERAPACIKMVVRGLACSKVCQPFDIALPDLNLTPPAMTWSDWWFMLGCAFLGGLILNIMPCVLPVLALKLKGLTQQGPDMFRSICLVTTGGIVTGFWGLAALTILVKTVFQQQVGWGMHLQNPYFVACMIIIMMFGGFGLLGLWMGHAFAKPLFCSVHDHHHDVWWFWVVGVVSCQHSAMGGGVAGSGTAAFGVYAGLFIWSGGGFVGYAVLCTLFRNSTGFCSDRAGHRDYRILYGHCFGFCLALFIGSDFPHSQNIASARTVDGDF
jgi:hypothetical protein